MVTIYTNLIIQCESRNNKYRNPSVEYLQSFRFEISFHHIPCSVVNMCHHRKLFIPTDACSPLTGFDDVCYMRVLVYLFKYIYKWPTLLVVFGDEWGKSHPTICGRIMRVEMIYTMCLMRDQLESYIVFRWACNVVFVTVS